MTDVLPCHIHFPACLWIIDPHSRAAKKNTSHGNQVLLQDTAHLMQRPCYLWQCLCHDPAGNGTTGKFDHCKEMQSEVVCTCLPFIRFGQNHLTRPVKGEKKARQTEKEMGRQHQGMDIPGVCRVPEGRAKWRKLVVKSSVAHQRPSQLRDRWRWRRLSPCILSSVEMASWVSRWKQLTILGKDTLYVALNQRDNSM